MAKPMTMLAGLAVAGATTCGLWTLATTDDISDGAGTRHVVNQAWIERMPEGPRDAVAHLVLIDIPEGGRLGAVGHSSQWRHRLELFNWGLEGNRLSVFFPHDRIKGQLQVRSWNCEGEAPEPFELCLELSNGSRQSRFYSLKAWEIDPKSPQSSLETLETQLPGLRTVRAGLHPMTTTEQDHEEYEDADLSVVFDSAL